MASHSFDYVSRFPLCRFRHRAAPRICAFRLQGPRAKVPIGPLAGNIYASPSSVFAQTVELAEAGSYRLLARVRGKAAAGGGDPTHVYVHIHISSGAVAVPGLQDEGGKERA